MEIQIRYFGWSGVAIRHADAAVGFDLSGGPEVWPSLGDAATSIVCVTHGHPDHVAGLRHLLAAPEARPRLAAVRLVSSRPVVDYVMAGGILPAGNTFAVSGGEDVSVNGVRVFAFPWKHAPLAPPGVRPKIAFAAHVMSHPAGFARVARGALGLPIGAPTLGFHVTFPDGFTVLNFAEGLHRLADRREVARVAGRLRAELLLFAVEPEDVRDVRGWVELLRPSKVLLYEAHRPWRELFGLPTVNLRSCVAELSAHFQSVQCGALIHPGYGSSAPLYQRYTR